MQMDPKSLREQHNSATLVSPHHAACGQAHPLYLSTAVACRPWQGRLGQTPHHRATHYAPAELLLLLLTLMVLLLEEERMLALSLASSPSESSSILLYSLGSRTNAAATATLFCSNCCSIC